MDYTINKLVKTSENEIVDIGRIKFDNLPDLFAYIDRTIKIPVKKGTGKYSIMCDMDGNVTISIVKA